jgi:hypothetical protein
MHVHGLELVVFIHLLVRCLELRALDSQRWSESNWTLERSEISKIAVAFHRTKSKHRYIHSPSLCLHSQLETSDGARRQGPKWQPDLIMAPVLTLRLKRPKALNLTAVSARWELDGLLTMAAQTQSGYWTDQEDATVTMRYLCGQERMK